MPDLYLTSNPCHLQRKCHGSQTTELIYFFETMDVVMCRLWMVCKEQDGQKRLRIHTIMGPSSGSPLNEAGLRPYKAPWNGTPFHTLTNTWHVHQLLLEKRDSPLNVFIQKCVHCWTQRLHAGWQHHVWVSVPLKRWEKIGWIGK